MGIVFEKKFQISAMDVDCHGRCKPSVLLFFAQEAASGHCDLLNLDWDTLAQKHLFWAVIRTKVKVLQLPTLGQTVTVQTWPMPTTRTAYPRAVSIRDKDGNELVRVISLWVLMDTNTRAMVLPGKSGICVAGQLRGCELTSPGSIVPKFLENTCLRRVSYSDLDRNYHMSNTRYMDWVDDLLPSSFHQSHPVREFTLCYLNEAREGQCLQLRYQMLDGPVFQVDGYEAEGEDAEKQGRIFSAQVLF